MRLKTPCLGATDESVEHGLIVEPAVFRRDGDDEKVEPPYLWVFESVCPLLKRLGFRALKHERKALVLLGLPAGFANGGGGCLEQLNLNSMCGVKLDAEACPQKR